MIQVLASTVQSCVNFTLLMTHILAVIFWFTKSITDSFAFPQVIGVFVFFLIEFNQHCGFLLLQISEVAPLECFLALAEDSFSALIVLRIGRVWFLNEIRLIIHYLSAKLGFRPILRRLIVGIIVFNWLCYLSGLHLDIQFFFQVILVLQTLVNFNIFFDLIIFLLVLILVIQVQIELNELVISILDLLSIVCFIEVWVVFDKTRRCWTKWR